MWRRNKCNKVSQTAFFVLWNNNLASYNFYYLQNTIGYAYYKQVIRDSLKSESINMYALRCCAYINELSVELLLAMVVPEYLELRCDVPGSVWPLFLHLVALEVCSSHPLLDEAWCQHSASAGSLLAVTPAN